MEVAVLLSFAAPLFLWYFLPAVLVVTWVVPRAARNPVLAVASLGFYAVGAGASTALLLGAIVVNFAGGLAIERARGDVARRRLVCGVVALDVAVLAVWKYAGFASRQAHALADHLGVDSSPIISLALPIGISFYTFHQISYVVDVGRRTRPAQRNLLTYVTYVAMFPQLVAGPIIRYHEIAEQLEHRQTRPLDDLAAGFPRFALGLVKKVVIADTIAPVADAAFALDGATMNSTAAWLAVVAYTLQIYFDFSAYSDMAIGLGRMLGLRLPENFARPYSASSMTDFWRRWHMSLSRWFRDYVYLPLGGNRGTSFQTYRNLWSVFVLCGVWHGANWTFLLWGVYHGGLLVAERTLAAGAPGRRGAVWRRALTLLLVMIGWVLFRADSIGEAFTILRHLVVLDMEWLPPGLGGLLTPRTMVVTAVAAAVVVLPPGFTTGQLLQFGRTPAAAVARVGVCSVGAAYAGLVVASGTFSPFLYYQF